MRDATIEQLAPLLGALRSYGVLDEVRPAAFHLEGRDFIHFHEEPDGIFADVLLVKGRVHMPVSTEAQQAELLEQIEEKLASLESRSQGRRGRSKRGDPWT